MVGTGRVPAVLRPTSAPWAVRRGVWAVTAAGLVAAAGVAGGRLDAVGLAYFGVACAAVFVTSGAYRTRLLSVVCQGAGAGAGIIVGVAVADSTPSKVAVAALAALVSGAVGVIGPMVTAAALMALVGLSFGEFARVPMPGWEQAAWYLTGTAVLGVIAVAGWPVCRDRPEWAAVAAVFDRSADLLDRIGTTEGPAARAGLAAASAGSRAEVFDHRLSTGFSRRENARRLVQAAALADQVALAAAGFFIRARPIPQATVEGLRQAATTTASKRVPVVPAEVTITSGATRSVQPLRARLVGAVELSVQRPALLDGVRLSLCMTIATAITCALHTESHSFWLPLTVAVAVRPEYASVYARTVNRTAGSLVGALLAAAVITALGTGWSVAAAASLSLGFAVCAAPKLYGVSVVGLTCSALLSLSIGAADPVAPGIRLIDTLIGCGIAITFGYLLWPERRSAPVALTETASAVQAYLRQAVTPPAQRRDLPRLRDRAYQLAHQSRQRAQAALGDPLPVRAYAAHVLPHALALENLTDEVTDLVNHVDSGGPAPERAIITELGQRITAAGQTLG